jgi:excisionase family DNA binding protein
LDTGKAPALLISVPEAGRRLGIPRNRCYQWCRKGILPCARDGGRIYVPASAVARLVAEIEVGEWKQL